MSIRGRGLLVLLLLVLASFVVGGLSRPWLASMWHKQAAPAAFEWPRFFSRVEIDSSVDGEAQPAYFLAAEPGEAKPLLVSLHVWSGSYASGDALALEAQKHGWNYIHPDFRGPNRSPESCLSDKVLADIDDAIAYALKAGNVDPDHIFVVGFSGGGYATLGAYLRSRHRVRLWQAWAPISDLDAWFWETTARGYDSLARSILGCTASGSSLDAAEARRRSPLYWPVDGGERGRLEIYAGIKDGYSGTVPISHSIQFYNKLTSERGLLAARVPETMMAALLTRAQPSGGQVLGDRAVHFQADAGSVALTIFDGGHEMLADQAFESLLAVFRQSQ